MSLQYMHHPEIALAVKDPNNDGIKYHAPITNKTIMIKQHTLHTSLSPTSLDNIFMGFSENYSRPAG